MPARSAGVLLFRQAAASVEVLLVHPGGPLWRNKDKGAWQIPKGLIEPGEDAAAAARRETEEELGIALCNTPWPLATIRQPGGKIVEAFALEQTLDADAIVSNRFDMEWPPRSGKKASFPEIDRAAWIDLATASTTVLASQGPLLEALAAVLAQPKV